MEQCITSQHAALQQLTSKTDLDLPEADRQCQQEQRTAICALLQRRALRLLCVLGPLTCTLQSGAAAATTSAATHSLALPPQLTTAPHLPAFSQPGLVLPATIPAAELVLQQCSAALPPLQPLLCQLHPASLLADLPRIVEFLPRRGEAGPPGLPRLVDLTQQDLAKLIFPDGLASNQAGVLILGVLGFVAVAGLAEVVQRAVAALTKDPAAQPPPKPLSREEELERRLFKQEIAYEKNRGIVWLLVVTLLALWTSGILQGETPMQP